MSAARRRRAAGPALLLAAAAACGPKATTGWSGSGPPPAPLVRVQARAGAAPVTGLLVRLTADSLAWVPHARRAGDDRAIAATTALASLARVELGTPMNQRDSYWRGFRKGAFVGTVLGLGYMALAPERPGGAVVLVLGSAWLGGIGGGSRADSPDPPRRWRVVHPRRAVAAR
jgi:hypothetical protein